MEVSRRALLSLVRRDNLGDPHPVLAGGELYVSPRFARDAERALREDLTGAGLDDQDQLGELRNTLALVHRSARTEYYGWMKRGDEISAVLVAGVGRISAALIRTGDRVRVERADSTRLAESLLRRLPEARAGHGESITLREADYSSARRKSVGSVMRRSAATLPEQVRRLNTLLRAPRHAVARLYAASRDDSGNRTRSQEWISVLDLEHGRWAVYASFGRGERAITAVPGTPQLLTGKLTELLRRTYS
ncbi:MAG: ESX secretion-associated protein EspG [Actinophytocola sp.]|uniref:ESX secretion-associated protein EspG n=1 Tax=Actinophytocola sp. TaxID=1872138 RepID=UPI003C7529CD